jgi:hypothetical protein
MASPIYTAIFLTEKSVAELQERYGPFKHPKAHAHHVTLVFRPSPKDLVTLEKYLEKEVEIEVIGYNDDERGQVVKVDVPFYLQLDGQVHHITLSTAEGVSPVYSNELLKQGWINVPRYRLKGVVRHFEKPAKAAV